jgi:hypothetical protein
MFKCLYDGQKIQIKNGKLYWIRENFFNSDRFTMITRIDHLNKEWKDWVKTVKGEVNGVFCIFEKENNVFINKLDSSKRCLAIKKCTIENNRNKERKKVIFLEDELDFKTFPKYVFNLPLQEDKSVNLKFPLPSSFLNVETGEVIITDELKHYIENGNDDGGYKFVEKPKCEKPQLTSDEEKNIIVNEFDTSNLTPEEIEAGRLEKEEEDREMARILKEERDNAKIKVVSSVANSNENDEKNCTTNEVIVCKFKDKPANNEYKKKYLYFSKNKKNDLQVI